ncbi:MAG: phosphatase PAP2 family protein [Oscillospiraceae bacterium]|nr:phosphatase PAP2 family protein [Oscillospiraceae bacterium]
MELLRFIESIRTPFLDTLIGLITRLGEETIGIVLLCLIFWCVSKKIAYVIGVAFFLSSLTVQGMKICFRIERPWVIDPTFEPVPGAKEYATGYSFPSGHTQSATAFYGALGSQVKPMAFKIILFAIPVLVAFSRLYLGVHTLQDVLVSLVITFLLIWLTGRIITSDVESKKKELAISLFMILYAVAVIIIAIIMYSNGTIEDRYIADCLKAAGAGIGFAVGMFVERNYIKFSVKSKNIGMHIIKVVIGIAGVLAFQEGLKLIIGTGFIVDMFRYFLMISWVTMLYPLIIKRCFSVKEA